MSVVFPPSIWAETAPGRSPAPALSGTKQADVTIVGGGFTGLSAALHLAQKGRSVRLLEAKAVGWGASGRNNGQVIPTLTAAEPDALIARHGAAGERFARLVGASAAYLFALIRDNDIAAEAEQTGWFQPAHSPGRVELSRRRVDAWQKLGFPAELRDAAGARALLGSDDWYGGMFNPTGGHINPLALARGLAAAAERHGAIIHEQTPATGWRRDGAHWIVETNAGRIESRGLVLATGTYTGELQPRLAPGLARSVIPVLSWQMASQPLTDAQRQTVVPGRAAISDTRGDLRFFRYDARNRLITGGAILGDWRVAERIKAKVAKNLVAAFPDLQGLHFTHVWNGYIGMNWDRFPRIHRLGPEAWSWAGCNGRGVALAVSLGREFADALDGVPEKDLALPRDPDPRPFPVQPLLRRIAPWYLAWMQRKDRIEPHFPPVP